MTWVEQNQLLVFALLAVVGYLLWDNRVQVETKLREWWNSARTNMTNMSDKVMGKRLPATLKMSSELQKRLNSDSVTMSCDLSVSSKKEEETTATSEK